MDIDRNATILVVDDEESLCELVSSALRFAGYAVRTERNGLDALRSVKTATPDLVVLDVNMPELDGFEVCRRLRRDGVQVPVIFLTARDDIDDLRTGFRQGGDDYLTKPFSLEELGLRIEALLRRVGGTRAAARKNGSSSKSAPPGDGSVGRGSGAGPRSAMLRRFWSIWSTRISSMDRDATKPTAKMTASRSTVKEITSLVRRLIPGSG